MFILSFFAWEFLIPAAVLISILIGLEKDQNWLSPVSVVVGFLGLQFLTDLNPYGYIVAHPGTVALALLGYVVIGVAWVFIKMKFYLMNVRDKVRDEMSAYDKRVGAEPEAPVLPADDATAWDKAAYESDVVSHAKALAKRAQDRERKVAETIGALTGHSGPTVRISRMKARIMNWMAAWPLSMLWTLINDPVRKFYNRLYQAIGGALQGMADKTFRDI